MTDLAAAALYQRLAGGAPPRVLDVRNAEEFARWRRFLGDAARSRVALFV